MSTWLTTQSTKADNHYWLTKQTFGRELAFMSAGVVNKYYMMNQKQMFVGLEKKYFGMHQV